MYRQTRMFALPLIFIVLIHEWIGLLISFNDLMNLYFGRCNIKCYWFVLDVFLITILFCFVVSLIGNDDGDTKDAVTTQLGHILKSKSTGMTSELGLTGEEDGQGERKLSTKERKKKLRDEEKRRMKEEERQRKQKGSGKGKKGKSKNPSGLDDFIQSESNLIPLFVEKCIAFIEEEGLDSEGIYRVPGNRAHVDLLFQNFDEGEFLVNLLFHDGISSIVVFW